MCMVAVCVAACMHTDEIFKANSAILNTLLTLINERLFDNGQMRQRVPLLSVVRDRACALTLHHACTRA